MGETVMNTIIFEDGAIIVFDASTQKHLGVKVTISKEDRGKVFDGGPKWCAAQRHGGKPYITRTINYKTQRLQRLIMDAPAGKQVDHISGDTFDNRRCNLRIAENAENQRNRLLCRKNTSGFKGVYWNKLRKMWLAQIRFNGARKSIGYFDRPEDAAAAYDKYADRLHGRFAMTNKNLGLI